jgi:phosphoribosylglycinamide formyltransferase-1
MNTPSIVIWASGSGSNAENIIRQLHPQKVCVKAIYCNNKNAGVLDRAHRLGIPVRMMENSDLQETSRLDHFFGIGPTSIDSFGWISEEIPSPPVKSL